MPRNFTCSMHTWMFEQQACLQNDIKTSCGNDAANFYADLQSNIFETNYPLVCDGDRLRTKSSHHNLSTTTAPMAKTEQANLFTKVRLSTRNPTIAPAAQRFPPNSTSRQQVTTKKPSITTSTTSSLSSNVSINSFRSNVITNPANNLPPHSVLLFSVLRKILTNSALQQRLNLKDLIQNIVKTTTPQTTKTQSLPRIHVTPNSSISTSTSTPIKFIVSGPTVLIATRVTPNNSTLPTNNSQSYQPTHKKWRPWYFTASVEDDQ
ncbi:hypothetical protein M3Y94_00281500 [Aphelenchoides besseyi]|nr:hypothetical protein M3Y94_00281500 [Aphelenchoides besseyi]